MRSPILILILILIPTFFTSCKIEKQEITIKDEMNNSISIKSIELKNDGSDIIIIGEVEKERKKFLYNIQTNKASVYIEESVSEIFNTKIEKDGQFLIYKSSENKPVFTINLKNYGFIEMNGNIPLNKEWSSTKKYLLLGQPQTDNSILLDVVNKRCVNLPVKGYIFLQWYNDDANVILRNVLNSKGNEDSILTYYWNLEDNDFGNLDIKYNPNIQFNWTPNGKNIYYITTKGFDGSIGNSFMYYNLDKKKWEELYSARLDILENSIKWISDDEVIFLTSDKYSINPIRILSRKLFYNAVKINIKTRSITKKELDSYLLSSYFWSSDNRFIYYTDNNGFYRSEINFNK